MPTGLCWRLSLSLLLGYLALGQRDTLAAEAPAVEVTLGELKVIGRPLLWNQQRVHLLARDGRLWDFAPSDAKDYHQTTEAFRSLSKNELRGELQREFGQGFEVTSTGNYLIVHPAGQQSQWAERFESLYRSFLHYFTARGFRPTTPPFPLVAVIFPRQEDFLRYAAREGQKLPPQVLGYYHPYSNRVALYDTTAGQTGTADWTTNAETIIHEAAHQTAFNTGIHSRWSMPPRWVAEGLGTMFEARGVWDSPHFTAQKDRINRGRFEAFQRYASSRRPKGALAALIASDRVFQSDPDGAYAEAWALSFFLAETEPRKYFAYLAKTASHRPFEAVRETDRLRDFTTVFGEDLGLLEAKLLRFIGDLK